MRTPHTARTRREDDRRLPVPRPAELVVRATPALFAFGAAAALVVLALIGS